MSSSVVAGSDEFFECVCQPCDSENERNEATGYCKQCCEYLCDMCVKYHRKVSKTKGHTILKPKEVPKVNVAPTAKDALVDICPVHDEEVIKYYCNDHGQLACSVCLSLDHRTCIDVSYIPDVSLGIKDSQEFRNVREDMHKIIASVAEDEDKAKKNICAAGTVHDKAVANVKAVQEEMNNYLKNIEKDLLEEIDVMKEKEKNEMEEEVKTYQSWISDLDEILHDFDEKEKHTKENALFIAMKQAKLKAAAVENDVKQHGEVVKPTKYTFEKDKILKSLHSALKNSMKLKFQGEQRDEVAKFAGDLNVKSTEDTSRCYIGGMLVLPDGKLALADMDNKAVKLINPDHIITARVSVSSSPYDLALVSKQEIAVTLGKEKKVQMLKLYDLTKLRSFPVTGTCKGIEYHNSNLFVLCQNPNAIQVHDLQGRKLQEINAVFSMPTRISLSKNGNMYVTDHVGQAVLHLAPDGSEKARLTTPGLRQPLGVVFNPVDSCVYVVGWSSNNILQLTSSAELIQTLYKEEDGLVKPVAIACKGKTLFVSFDSGSRLADTIKVLEIK